MVHRRGDSLKYSHTARPSRSSKWLCYTLIAPMSLAVQVPVDSTEVADSTVVTHDMNVLTSPLPDSGDGSYERVTKITMGGGGGRYFREVVIPFGTECYPEGTALLPFKEDYIDVGAEIDYQANRVAHVGTRGGYVGTDASAVFDTMIVGADLSDEESTFYLNPYFSFEWKWIGIGAGGLVSTHPLRTGEPEDVPLDTDPAIYPSGHLRFGSLSSFYISGHLWEGVPVYSGGAMLMGGVGVRPVAPLELYAGYCAESPYQEATWLGRLTVDLGRSWTILTTVRFPTDFTSYDPFSGETFSDSEYGVGVSLSYRLYTLTPGN
jgi:hypothetical protein